MKDSPLVLQTILVLIAFGITGAAAADEPGPLDGYWFSDEFSYAFKIEGETGVAVLSNSPRYAPGDVMLRFRLTEGSLTGEQIFTDGRWYDITGHRIDENTLELRGGGYTWRMIRR